MCGIAGIIGKIDEGAVRRMTAAMAHRGPNAEGYYATRNAELFRNPVNLANPVKSSYGKKSASRDAIPVSLGFRRLKIQDLSESANQPMCSADGRFALVFNGEIYNFRELRRQLEGDFPFRSAGDTEVLLHAYEKWGDACLEHLRGMFSFAIWDHRENRLFAAVDRMGIKPFLYAQIGDVFVFASELRAMLAGGLVPPRLSLEGLRSYLTFGSTSWPGSMVDQVYRLKPGQSMVFQNARWELRDYWKLPREEISVGTRDDAVRGIREILRETIRQHMVADVPLGAFLSGGLDSSAIVALMREAGVSRIKTFSVGFSEPGRPSTGVSDESASARKVAAYYHTEHEGWTLASSDIQQIFSKYRGALDHPSMDGFNTFIVSSMTKEHVTVALSGLGADELFGGYHHLRAAYWASSRKLSSSLNCMFGKAFGMETLQRILRRMGMSSWTIASQLKPLPRAAWYRAIRQIFSDEEQYALMGHSDRFALLGATPAPSVDYPGNAFAPMSIAELQGYLANTLLRDTDTMSMANSLEVRVPFLDHKLVEFVRGLPPDWFFKSSNKSLLVDAVSDIVPEFVHRRSKAYFNLPIGVWIQKNLQGEIDDALNESTARKRGIFDPKAVRQLRSKFSQTGVGAHKIWMLAVFEWWLRNVESQTACKIEMPG